MALKNYAKKDEIPTEQQAGAIELKDGTFAVVEPDDTSGLQSALDTERGKREAAEALVKKTAKELTAAEAARKAASHGLTAEQLQQIRAEASKDAEDKLAAKEAELIAERTASRTKDIGGAFKTLAGEQKFLGTKLDDLFRLHGDEFDLTDDRKLMVKGKPGIDPKKHMETLAKSRPEWVEGTKAAGGGAAGTTTAAAGASTLTAEEILKNPSRAFETANA